MPISVQTVWTIMVIFHSLLAVALLAALTHQAATVVMPVRHTSGTVGFVTRFRAVTGPAYATAICILWILTMVMGALILARYDLSVKIQLEQLDYWKTLGAFNLKEQMTVLGLLILPAYWLFWKNYRSPEYDSARKWSTVVLTAICWFSFIVGHLMNNIRGFAV